jgi:hypothetical protein
MSLSAKAGRETELENFLRVKELGRKGKNFSAFLM